MDVARLDELPALLARLPRRYRALLLQSKAHTPHDPEELEQLLLTLRLERHAQRPPTPEEICACRAIAAEVLHMGNLRASSGLRRLHSSALCVCFCSRWCSWIRARDNAFSTAAAPSCGEPQPVMRCAPLWKGGPQGGVYLSYDTAKYDFRSLLHRVFADVLASVEPHQCGTCGATHGRCKVDGLSLLHATTEGKRELGYMDLELAQRGELLAYSKGIDDATRYGCSTFNRIFKASPLRHEFLALYQRLLVEVLAPQLNTAGLVYQASPVFRVFLSRHLAVGPRHTDAAYHKQPNEINVWVPFTDVFESNSLQVESTAGMSDFEPILCSFGQMYLFRGNECEHFTECNLTNHTRVSMDFRVIRREDLEVCPVAQAPPSQHEMKGAGEYFTLGRYYQRTWAGN
ncbi:hypothetical protein AB1Y20_010685 [Prymnesium parvum]|uniref:NAD(+)--protein-arginine ADP-ribosyltransferase n=1 Tax=Prymnesium parvum TaxID=97485 RepID=A0AB34IPF6_PRYPA